MSAMKDYFICLEDQHHLIMMALNAIMNPDGNDRDYFDQVADEVTRDTVNQAYRQDWLDQAIANQTTNIRHALRVKYDTLDLLHATAATNDMNNQDNQS